MGRDGGGNNGADLNRRSLSRSLSSQIPARRPDRNKVDTTRPMRVSPPARTVRSPKKGRKARLFGDVGGEEDKTRTESCQTTFFCVSRMGEGGSGELEAGGWTTDPRGRHGTRDIRFPARGLQFPACIAGCQLPGVVDGFFLPPSAYGCPCEMDSKFSGATEHPLKTSESKRTIFRVLRSSSRIASRVGLDSQS
ncbi:hypothetical protein chiPu_0001492 [Chiloscyllium punctatum]|uniref:Uncharacterized protein n=1 Tax=Chiloscyllium punctatum TaxID=137246 RepID=A0A401RYB4_CHIPU|nr:hypothetical protein [Chiloscyllium punctatum]